MKLIRVDNDDVRDDRIHCDNCDKKPPFMLGIAFPGGDVNVILCARCVRELRTLLVRYKTLNDVRSE